MICGRTLVPAPGFDPGRASRLTSLSDWRVCLFRQAGVIVCGAPGRTRTRDLVIRSDLL